MSAEEGNVAFLKQEQVCLSLAFLGLDDSVIVKIIFTVKLSIIIIITIYFTVSHKQNKF